MSLINDVLRDLEQRKTSSGPFRSTTSVRPGRSKRSHWPLWLLAAVIAGGALHWVLNESPPGNARQPVLLASTQNERATPEPEPAPVLLADAATAALEPAQAPTTESPQPSAGQGERAMGEGSSDATARPAPPNEARGAAEPKETDPPARADSEPVIESRQAGKAEQPDPSPATSSIRIEPAGPAQKPGEDRLDDARRAFARGHFELAASQARALVSDHPQLTDGHLLLARTLLRQGQTRSAINTLDRALSIADAPARPAALLGRILVERGEIARARSILEAHRPEPMADPDYHLLLAATQHQAGDHAAAAATYRQLGDVIPGNARIWIGLGASLESLERFDEAVAAYQRAIESRDPRAARYARQRIEQLK
ncbi:tetratricopeptide repeat protein [Wenzhouxiangella sp. XN201]|uniref:tetratricopeptide repeat protein n=1 Tax=Wenzhouxiangella sp. XN201 TaxID=2710755 RepID=UPI0013C68CB6|nr:tetratricopeptide repeat protein [Wenzhouxiangella sp. XN201]NEZ03703.1 tetratricopeptide repeat protein [Wenzhouxiangella sp. XN201]